MYNKMNGEGKVKLENAMNQMINELDKSFLRDLQGKMYKCAASCCDDKDASMQSVQTCIEICGRPLSKAQQYVQLEFDNFQDRIQRCIKGCNDTVKDKMGLETNEAEIAKYTMEFEKCAKKCIDFHVDVIPNTLKQMKYKLKSQTQ